MARRESSWKPGIKRAQTGTGEIQPGEGPAIGAENPGLPGLFIGARNKGPSANRGRMVIPFRPNLNPVGVDLGQYFSVQKKEARGSQRRHGRKF